MCKYIFVTGGVCSSLGKGIASASIGALLKASGFKVFTQKLDPYLNVDPGTMSPFQHGEVFVTDDGGETDLDLGHYERFIDVHLSKLSSVATGKIYSEVLEKERKGKFLGKTIQIIPHITNAIKDKITQAAEKSGCDIMMVEIGGTVGDIEGLPFLEAIRQLRNDLGQENTLFIHLTLLPYLAASKELKTKPTQASVRELRSIGIQPDFILARADYPIKKEHLKKIALFCDAREDHVIPAQTIDSIYKVPLDYQKYNVAQLVAEDLKLGKIKPELKDWKDLNRKINAKKPKLKIALAGKYTGLDDAYLSVIESLKIACYHQNHELDLTWIDTEKLEAKDKKTWNELKKADGILIPGGFGSRGIEGKIAAAKYSRENKVPYLGLCLGMQIMTIEFARHALEDPTITSEEFDENKKSPQEKYVIHFLPGQSNERDKGGTLRLGMYECKLKKDTKTYDLYKKPLIEERHRHRYEFNNDYKKLLEEKGLTFPGINPKTNLVEIAENTSHPFMIGSQFHPEFLSRPHRPHPLFAGFIKAAIKNK
ncbi:CTP synthase [Candidatus Peregrinibacteria bacterium]|nr:CTP synthase [Candidatus Peregrinibacteria bacterium]MBT4056118.1 CTP synthase [Candidatus Peregrinibacteria bacterium]